MKNEVNISILSEITRQKLIQNDLISLNTEISLQPNYKIILNGEIYSHYIISCSNSDRKFFLKVSKDGDKTSHCNKYLKRFYQPNGEFAFPIILVPPYEVNGINYFITTFTEGEDLDALAKTLTKKEWDLISHKLCIQLELLSTIHENLYSENNEFLNFGCAEILKEKLAKRLEHPAFQTISSQQFRRAYNRCCEILDDSSFSIPTLIHMDIKPANIIYNPKTENLTLIDFEHARFGDIDFGWTQILLTGINKFSDEYKKFVLPHIIKNRLTLDEALQIPKYRTYIFYQTACNIIYYYDRSIECPKDMVNYFNNLLEHLSKERRL